jgi:nicotinate-nucleotide adenylyltransferase
VGIFGGSFDPIHLGHLILAEAALEELHLDFILFVPTGVSPFKTDRPPSVTPEDRLRMISLAIAEEPRFQMDLREIQREGPSYTIDTVDSFLLEHPGRRFLYLIGSDHLGELDRWHRIDELKNLIDFAVLDRGTLQEGSSDFQVVQRRIDISSTEIRDRLKKGLSIRFMVPAPIYDHIMNNKLYGSQESNNAQG